MPDIKCYEIWQTVASRRFLPSWSFRLETTGLFPGAGRSEAESELQICPHAHIDSTDTYGCKHLIRGRTAPLQAPTNTNSIHMEQKDHKWPNSVPTRQVIRCEICKCIAHMPSLSWTCILTIMDVSSLCQTLSPSSIYLQALGFLIRLLTRILGSRLWFPPIHRLAHLEVNWMILLGNYLGANSVWEDRIDLSDRMAYWPAAC